MMGSGDLINPPSKEQKLTITGAEETLEDRISELPVFLLVHILSLLPTTKDAIKTYILSKRWRYLWTSLDNLRFLHEDFIKIEKNSSFFEHVLAHSVSPKIRNLELQCYLMSQYMSQISRCLSFAADKNVEKVVLCSDGRSEFIVPEFFCTCASLITLDSLGRSFNIDGFIQWKSLQNIHLVSGVLSDADLVNLLSGCPALETIRLTCFQGFRRLEINSLKLKTLSLSCCNRGVNEESDNSLEIFAPYLQHLEISGILYYLKFRLVDVSSVVNAKLTLDIECIKDIYIIV